MNENQKFYNELVQRYIDGRANEKELALFFHLLKEGKLDQYLEENEVQINISNKINPKKVLYIKYLKYAAILFLVGFTTISIIKYRNTLEINDQKALLNKILPASEKAILLLSDGEEIKLDSNSNGLYLNGGQLKNGYGKLVNDNINEHYLINVPKGGTFHLVLSDGSKVWLNSDSKLKFPQHFNDGVRQVELTGEGFFEISKRTMENGKQQSFIVKTKRQSVEVLGTSFNIRAYGNEENVKSTLFSGIVKTKDNYSNQIATLAPGQQAISDSTGALNVSIADLEEISGWRSGSFIFNDAPLKEILSQMSTWYDVKIKINGNEDFRFNGLFSRNLSLGDALNVIGHSTDLDVKYKDNQVIVSAK
ncbi:MULTISPECIES: FecR family protein [unclassified Sphingobacterium]|uniref:FecR family protein n=1 Tax=unclassified Sphingobacterium TaxID=2609468 RepID=UPI0020C41382|nr:MULTISPECIES: FecR family protein [unclassified Sphingobacterium]